ncbi:virB8 family protein [Sphingomonas beigongshangi]|uniref:virB8 family protein n=1 Tax=Sphingomonas beigongshangi TaxID=2782540 RepID=UPI00193C0949|nr:type IV secretion system protein [Sphingomonas beigongshangi]
MTEQIDSTYFDLARGWADERDASAARSRRLAWTIAGIAAAIAALEAAALALAMPLKQIEPIAVLVDRTTGNVERVDLDQPRALLANQALQQSLLAQYVTAREGFDPVGIRAAYRKVALWSSGQARASYLEQMRHNPPATMLSAAKREIGLAARIRGISPLSDGSALVRFEVAPVDYSGRLGTPRPYAATIAYQFRGEPLGIEDRLDNPLGFAVKSYRVDAETPPAPAATAQQGGGL